MSVRVVSDGERVLLSPDDGGDEPVMLARRLSGVPVLIGRRRPLAARAAVSRFGADVCILDDGFQVWNLAKNLEIVLLDGERAFDNGYVLPRGLLREPPQHLARADVVLLMEPPPCPTWAGDSPPALRALRGRVRDLAPRALLVEARRVPSRLWDLADGRDSEIEALSGAKVLALSAIGNPAGFEGLLRELGAEVYAMRLPDHHRYGEADLEQILTAARRSGASCIVTTDKDAVKLATLCCAAHEPGPLRKASRRGRGLLPWRRALTPGWGIRGGAADDPAEGGAPAGRMGAAPEIAGFLAERGAPPLRVLSIRLQFLAGEEALRERVLALAGRVPNA